MANLLGLGAGRHQHFFFNGESSTKIDTSSIAKSGVGKKISFADKVKGDAHLEVNLNELPVPSMRGKIPSIKISQKAVERGMSYCKYSLIGRLDFNSIKLEDVRRMAQNTWKPQGDWKIVPLGRGFFMIRLICEDDFLRIWGGGPWKFGSQILRLAKWDPDFDPDEQRSSQAMVWVKFPKLKQQFWDYEILMSMGKTLGASIGIDKHTADREYGFFASILVEIDLAKPIPPQILVEVEGGKDFMQEVVVGKLPRFCEYCKSIGHFMSDCKVLKNFREKEIVQAEAYKEANNRRKGKINQNKNKEVDEVEMTTNGKVVAVEDEIESIEKSEEEENGIDEEAREDVVGLSVAEPGVDIHVGSPQAPNKILGSNSVVEVICKTPVVANGLKAAQHIYFKSPSSLEMGDPDESCDIDEVHETQPDVQLARAAEAWADMIVQEEGEWTKSKKRNKKSNWKEKVRSPLSR